MLFSHRAKMFSRNFTFVQFLRRCIWSQTRKVVNMQFGFVPPFWYLNCLFLLCIKNIGGHQSYSVRSSLIYIKHLHQCMAVPSVCALPSLLIVIL
jgi:hypothetical protein